MPRSHSINRSHAPPAKSVAALGDRRQRARLLFVSLILLPSITLSIAFVAYRYYQRTQRIRSQRERASKFASSSDIEEMANHFIQLIEQNSGGPMSNACIHSTKRFKQGFIDEIVLFAAGGWKECPHSQFPLPMYPSPVQREWPANRQINESLEQSTESIAPSSSITPVPSAAEIDALDLYWLTRALGQSRLYNASFATLLALSMQQLQSDQQPLQYQHHAIRLLSLSIGTFVDQRPIVDVVCEIGSLNERKHQAFVEQHFSYPDVHSPNDFASVVDFGTQRIAAYAAEEGHLPAADSAFVEDVFWHRQRYSWPRAQDVWLTFETATPSSDSASTARIQRFHLDLSAAQYGLHAEPHYDTTAGSIATNPDLHTLNQRHSSPYSILHRCIRLRRNRPLSSRRRRGHSSSTTRPLSNKAAESMIELSDQLRSLIM